MDEFILGSIEQALGVKLIEVKNITSMKRGSYITENGKVVGLNLSGYRNLENVFNFISEIQSLERLILSHNNIEDLNFLVALRKLIYLDISNNNVYHIKYLLYLTDLRYLDVSSNNLEYLEYLEDLEHLRILILRNNRIRHFSNRFPVALDKLDLSHNDISEVPNFKGLNSLKHLNMANNPIGFWPFSDNLSNLTFLDLSECRLHEIDKISAHTRITKLYLQGNFINDIRSIDYLHNLKELNLRRNNIETIDEWQFRENIGIEVLDLRDNNLSNVNFLESLLDLKRLHLGNNRIIYIDVMSRLLKLRFLDLSHNRIDNISVLKRINLKDLVINDNPIDSIEDITELILNGLKSIKIHNTVISSNLNLELKPLENHLDIFKNRINIYNSIGESVEGDFPVKVLLLGNHGSGKSQLLNFIIDEKILTKSESESTDILQIKFYKKRKNSVLPTAIFYDFGGQDFYHGLYRIFLSSQSIYCLLWHEKTNRNYPDIDTNGNPIQNFNIDYWIGQKKYNEYKTDFEDDLLLIETHSDLKKSKKPTYYVGKENSSLPTLQFYISLQFDNSSDTVTEFQRLNLMHLKSNLLQIVDEKKISFEQKEWYINFIKYVTSPQRKEQATSLNELLRFFDSLEGTKVNKLKALKTELEQLHRKGLVLYYKELGDVVWLNPLKIVNFIKANVLIFNDIKKYKGVVDSKYFTDKNIDKNILTLLEKQKVIFHHGYGLNSNKEKIEQYIVPNYLPLVDKGNDYELFTFGIHENHVFTLKFLEFIPLGLINQLICFFGKLPDYKRFWRDQILFTFENKSKVLISLNNIDLEIKVYIHFTTSNFIEKENIIKYLYSCILSFYWDNELISYSEYVNSISGIGVESDNITDTSRVARQFYEIIDCEIPDDLYLSINDKDFISVKKLSLIEEFLETGIFVYSIDIDRKILSDIFKEVPLFTFRIFTNKKLKKMKKVFVSYSHQDYKAMETLTNYLVGFVRNKEIEMWTDGKLQSGVKVKDEIISNLEDADIVIMLISQAFIASDFIFDHELQNAMKKKLSGKGEIVPIVLSRSSIFDLKLDVSGSEGEMHEVKMGDYFFIPQDEQRNLKPIEEWDLPAKAWMQVYQDIKRKI